MASTVWGLISQTNPDWNAVRERISTHPTEANCSVMKPLYVAVRHDNVPPADIITSLVSSHNRHQQQGSSYYNSPTRLSEGEKLDILTEACYNTNMKSNIVMILLEAFDLKPSMEFVYRLIKDIISFRREAIENEHWEHQHGNINSNEGDRNGDEDESSCTVTALIHYYPSVLSTRDRHGNTLLHHGCNRGNIPTRLIATMIDISMRNNIHTDDYIDDKIDNNNDGNGDDTTYTSNNQNHGGLMTSNRQNRTPLHNLCRIIDDDNNEKALEKILCCYQKCPDIPILHLAVRSVTQPRYFRFLMESLERSLSVDPARTRDYRNRSLVEAAIENACSNINASRQKQQQRLEHARGILQIILQWPCNINNADDQYDDGDADTSEEMTLAYFRDVRKRLPIHYACDLGLPWDGGLQDIVESNISALEDKDRVTGLLPFMLAAATSVPTRTADVSATYELLRRNPNILRMLRPCY